MPIAPRRLSVWLLLALLASMLPAARPALAQPQTFVVTTVADGDDGGANACAVNGCTLREAIRLANENPADDTISFSISAGSPPFTIAPDTQLPALSGGGTTIQVAPAHSVVLSGLTLAAQSRNGHGLVITSANNEVSGLVINGFPGSTNFFATGSGIFIYGAAATDNRIYNNRIGVDATGTTAVPNGAFGVLIANGASRNRVGDLTAGGDADPARRNLISGNRRGNVRIANVDDTQLHSDNQILGNYIGTNAAGSGVPGGVDNSQVQAGVSIERGAVNTLISENLIGGMTGNDTIAGVLLDSGSTAAGDALRVRGTVLRGNLIGVSEGGAAVANRFGVLFGGNGYGAADTVIGNPANLAGGRNVIAGNQAYGIYFEASINTQGNTTIAGNYIGLSPSGAPLGNGSGGLGEGIYVGSYGAFVGSPGQITIGPGNVISANFTFGIRLRSGGHVIAGNYLGTDPAGGVSRIPGTANTNNLYANGAASVFIENGSGVRVGGPAAADRNVIAFSASRSGGVGAGVLIDPAAVLTSNCLSPGQACTTGGHTIQNNYIGVNVAGSARLNGELNEATDREGIRVDGSDGNTISGNVIAGVGRGLVLRDGANNNTVSNNRIGTSASGALDGGIRNAQDGVRILSSDTNQLSNNLIAYNGSSSTSVLFFHGVRIETSSGITLTGNNLVGNGSATRGNGVLVSGGSGNRITQSTTSLNGGATGVGIALDAGSNADRAAPSSATFAVVNGPPPRLTGDTDCNSGCTVEVFTSSVSQGSEGPIYLASGPTNASGGFDINITGCLQYLTATVTDTSGNTSPFSAVFDSGAPGSGSPCAAPPSLTLGAAANPARTVQIGGSTIYTHTLSHNSPVERSYTVAITSSRGWASGPTTVTIPAVPGGQSSASVDFGISVQVPAGAAPGDQEVTTVRAYYSTLVSSAQQTDTTTAQAVVQNPAAASVSGAQSLELPPGQDSLTFVHTVTNTGDLSGSFEVRELAFVGSPPAGLSPTITAAFVPSSTIAGQGNAELRLTVSRSSPGAQIAAGSYPFRFRVGVGAQQTSLVEDTVVVPAQRSFSFTQLTPELEPKSTPAGADVFFEYTLTNTGNATDSFSISAALPSATPGGFSLVGITPASPISLGAGISTTVRVTVRVLAATPVATYSLGVTATPAAGAGAPAAITRTNQIAVTGGGSALISPGTPSPDPVDVSGGPQTVTIINTVTNGGNQAVPIINVGVSGAPAGWSALVSANTCPSGAPGLGIGASCTFTVSVDVPADEDAGAYPLAVTATADNSPGADVVANATNTVSVAAVYGVELGPTPQSQTGAPGQVLTFTHTLTNTGNATDSFDLILSAPDAGWQPVVSPASLELLSVGRDMTRTVTLQVTVPAGQLGGASTTISLTARSRGDTGAEAVVQDTATVQSVTAADLSPGTTRNVEIGQAVSFTHRITNTGSVAASFSVAASNSQAGWDPPVVTGSPTGPLAPGQGADISVAVSPPAGAPAGERNTVTLQAFVEGTSAPLLDEEQDEAVVGPAFDVLLAPDNIGPLAKTGPPDSTVVFTHTLTNGGTSADSFRLRVIGESNGWPVALSADLVDLGPGESREIEVRVYLRPGLRAGDSGEILIEAQSLSDPDIVGTARSAVSVERVGGVDLAAAQVRSVRPDSGTIRLPLALTNTGSEFDLFSLRALGTGDGWGATLRPPQAAVDKDETLRVLSVDVTVPSAITPGSIRVIEVEACSDFDPSECDRVSLTFVYVAPPATEELLKTYLPMVRR